MIQIRARPRVFPLGGLDRTTVAVLLIDMQRDFLDPDGYLASLGYSLDGVRSAIEPAGRLLAAARRGGVTVIHTRQGHWSDLRDSPSHVVQQIREDVSAVGRPGPLGRSLIRGEPGFEIVPELAPLPGEVVIDKSGYGAFWGTELGTILATERVRSLILAGVTTDVCVHSTVREATDRGFECLTVTDACGSGDAEAHRAALEMVVENGVFGAVADAASVVKALDELRARASRV